jgi:PAS domain S-box-containing protein
MSPSLKPQIIRFLDAFEEAFNSSSINKPESKELLDRIRKEAEILVFKSERTVKEKGILFSLLTKTSQNLRLTLDKLEVRANELETVLTTIPALVYFKDINKKYILVNKAFEEIVNLPSNKISGKDLSEILPNYIAPDFFSKEDEVLRTGITFYNIDEQIQLFGHTHFLSTNLAPILNAEGQPIGLVGISLDITDRKLAELEMVKAKEQAEAGTKSKSDFLANMSHEIRTPMNAIIGSANILRQTPIDKQQEEFVEIITSSGKSLLNIINDILDFSKIEAGKIDFESVNFDIRKVVLDIENLHRLDSTSMKVDYRSFLDSNLPEFVKGDPNRLRQILLNLTNNAIKFTHEGYVHVKVSLLENSDNFLKIKFIVEDTGIGIPDDSIGRLFLVFSQVDASRTKRFGGTGLGLAISKHLTELMGGELGVESKLGKGSVFWFTAKFQAAEIIEDNKALNISKDNKPVKMDENIKVLLVEDNKVNQIIANHTLKKMGFQVEIANNGLEAIDFFLKANFQIILMDVQMPELNGLDATLRIREIEKTENRPVTPIIAMTANAMAGDREMCLEAGMNDYVSKPFSAEELSDKIQQYLV